MAGSSAWSLPSTRAVPVAAKWIRRSQPPRCIPSCHSLPLPRAPSPLWRRTRALPSSLPRRLRGHHPPRAPWSCPRAPPRWPASSGASRSSPGPLHRARAVVVYLRPWIFTASIRRRRASPEPTDQRIASAVSSRPKPLSLPSRARAPAAAAVLTELVAVARRRHRSRRAASSLLSTASCSWQLPRSPNAAHARVHAVPPERSFPSDARAPAALLVGRRPTRCGPPRHSSPFAHSWTRALHGRF